MSRRGIAKFKRIPGVLLLIFGLAGGNSAPALAQEKQEKPRLTEADPPTPRLRTAEREAVLAEEYFRRSDSFNFSAHWGTGY